MTRGVDRLGRAEAVWFAPGSAATLQMVRVLVVTTALVDLWLRRGAFERLPDRAAVTWEPVSLLALLGVGPPSALLVGTTVGVAALGCLLALRRDASRHAAIAGPVAYALLDMGTNSLGKIDHSHQPLVVMLLVVALAGSPPLDAAPSWRHRWPVQACRAAFAMMLFAAAWSKITAGGAAWVVSDNLRNILVAEVLVLREVPLPDVALWIASEPWRWQLAALGTIAGEAGLLASLVVRRQPWRALLVVGGMGTVVAITLLMGLVGFPIVVLGMVLLDLDRLLDRARPHRVRGVGAAVAAIGIVVLAWTTFLDTGRWLPILPLVAATGVVASWSRRSAGRISAVETSRPSTRMATSSSHPHRVVPEATSVHRYRRNRY